MTGPQEGGVAEHELMRYRARCQQPLRAIEIRQDALEQPRPLDEGALQQTPLLGRHDEGDEIDAPRLGRARRIGEQIVRDSRFPHPRIELLHAQRAGGGGELGELVQQRLPVRLDCAGALDQLVEAPGQGVIPADQAVVRKRLCSNTPGHRFATASPCRSANSAVRHLYCRPDPPGARYCVKAYRTITVARMTRQRTRNSRYLKGHAPYGVLDGLELPIRPVAAEPSQSPSSLCEPRRTSSSVSSSGLR